MILFYTLMMLYALAFCAVCRQCHQLKVRHTFMLSVIMLVVGVLLYQWLPHHKILVSLTDATLYNPYHLSHFLTGIDNDVGWQCAEQSINPIHFPFHFALQDDKNAVLTSLNRHHSPHYHYLQSQYDRHKKGKLANQIHICPNTIWLIRSSR